jgi:AcrR family transcriptional regulator
MAYRQTAKVLEKKEQTRQAILHAAATQIKTGRPLTMDAVAETAGLSVGSLYTYFRHRADLVLALFQERAQLELDAMSAALRNQPDVADALTTAATQVLRRARRNPGMALFLLLERMDKDPRLEEEKLAFHRCHCEYFAQTVREGIRQNVLPMQDADVTAAAMLGLMIEITIRALGHPADPVAKLSESKLEVELIRIVQATCGIPLKPTLIPAR